MLNNPNEWHNEEDNKEDVNEYAEDEDSSEEDFDEENEDESSENVDPKKKYIIAGAIVLIVLLFSGCIMGILRKKPAKDLAETNVSAIEETSPVNISGNDVSESDSDLSLNKGNSNADDKLAESSINTDDGIPIDIEIEGVTTADGKPKTISEDDIDSGIGVESDDEIGTFKGKPGEETVTIAIGDVGRKNPFMPIGKIGTASSHASRDTDDVVVDFEVIEPPSLGKASADIAKLLQTKVTGILYDTIKPSAIINIDGEDQLIKIGDVLSGFEIISITKNKVVIRSDNNVYRASVGQPLNAEKIDNPVEISNLETKFWGSMEHN